MKKAFTLIELSIVLVIIGLVVGGVLVGQDLIAAAKLREINSEAQQVIIKIRLFKDKFGQLPGDSDKMWGFYGTQCATQVDHCNGDGNKNIYSGTYRLYNGGSGHASASEDDCVYRHLALAGLWDKQTSAAACSNNGISLLVHPDGLPKVQKSWMHVSTWKLYQTKNANAVTFSVQAAGYMNKGLITRDEAKSIDEKFDDGSPTSGQIWVSRDDYVGACVTANSNNAGTAGVDWHANNSLAGYCKIHFWMD